MQALRSRHCNVNHTELYQLVFAFVSGAVFAPFAKGFWWLIISLVINEIVIIYVTRMLPPFWRFEMRVVLTLVYLMGWITSRQLFSDETGFEELSGLPQRLWSKA
jgi:hypothetical protein